MSDTPDTVMDVRESKQKYRFADVQSALAFIVTAGFFACVGMYLWKPPTTDSSTLQMISLLIGGITAKFGDVIAYYFNSSKGSKDSNEVVASMAKSLAGTNGNGNTNKLVVSTPTPSTTTVETKVPEPLAPHRQRARNPRAD